MRYGQSFGNGQNADIQTKATKGNQWAKKKYFKTIGEHNWVFAANVETVVGLIDLLRLKAVSIYKQPYHRVVKCFQF